MTSVFAVKKLNYDNMVFKLLRCRSTWTGWQTGWAASRSYQRLNDPPCLNSAARGSAKTIQMMIDRKENGDSQPDIIPIVQACTNKSVF